MAVAASAVCVPLFLRDEAPIQLEEIDKLAVYFGLALQPTGKAREA